MLYMFLRRVLVRPVLLGLLRPRIRGLDRVPPTGGLLLVSNHLSALDTVLLPSVLPRQIRFVAKQEYFTGPLGLFLRAIGTIPIDRSGGRSSIATLNAAAGILQRGDVFCIYPEGTRSPDGRLYEGHTGAARLIQQSDAVVVPVAMVGTDQVLPPYGRRPNLWRKVPGKRLPRRNRTEVLFGEPIDVSAFRGQSGRTAARGLTDTLMRALAELSGQTYVEMYATEARELLAKGEDPAQHVTPRRQAS